MLSIDTNGINKSGVKVPCSLPDSEHYNLQLGSFEQAVFIDTHGFNKTGEPQHGQHLESSTDLYESPHLKNASHSGLLFGAGLKGKVCAVWQILIVSER
jgi:hypothetical protein